MSLMRALTRRSFFYEPRFRVAQDVGSFPTWQVQPAPQRHHLRCRAQLALPRIFAPEALSRLVAGAGRLVGGEQLSGSAASPLFGKGLCTVRD
jgi:hypothetical protein